MSSKDSDYSAELVHAGKVALRVAIGTGLFFVFFFGILFPASLGMMMAAVALASLGAGVVAALVALSFAEEDNEEH